MSISDAAEMTLNDRALTETYKAGYEQGFNERSHGGDSNPAESADQWLQSGAGQAIKAALQGRATQATEGTIEVDLFDKPSGNVRGIVTAFLSIKGKNKRIAHATLLVGEAATVALDVPAKLTLDLVGEVSALLTNFAATVHKHDLQG